MSTRRPARASARSCVSICGCIHRSHQWALLMCVHVCVAGDEVTVEMHQQPGDRSCANEAIGGDHYGPINVCIVAHRLHEDLLRRISFKIYMAKVDDATTAVGSSAAWFKVSEMGMPSTGLTWRDDGSAGARGLSLISKHASLRSRTISMCWSKIWRGAFALPKSFLPRRIQSS